LTFGHQRWPSKGLAASGPDFSRLAMLVLRTLDRNDGHAAVRLLGQIWRIEHHRVGIFLPVANLCG
jgi:hypothetical protein